MDIFLFILFLFAVAIMRSVPKIVSKKGKENDNVWQMLVALILDLGFMFVMPLILNWYLRYFFESDLSYWSAFAFLFVLSTFTYYVDTKD